MTSVSLAAMAADLLQATDPVEVARRAGLEPDPWQQRFLRSRGHRILLNCSRQSGKSTMAAMRAVHTALYEPGSLTLLVSPSERQSSELARKVRLVMAALEWPVAAEQRSQLQTCRAPSKDHRAIVLEPEPVNVVPLGDSSCFSGSAPRRPTSSTGP